jgi:uncharacterized protein (UPF0264 family)
MRLLVSVASGADASAALAGGADVIDAKDPFRGALGAVSLETLRDIHSAVSGAQPVSAALGDATDEASIARDAHAFIAAGALFVKVGFLGVNCERIAGLIAAAVQGARTGTRELRGDDRAPQARPGTHQRPKGTVSPSGPAASPGSVIAVQYADMTPVAAPASLAFIASAAHVGAAGVLLDTANKRGPGLRGLVAPAILGAWIAAAHNAGLLVAVAGKLTVDDLSFVSDAGADIAGVRGAACERGRTGRVTAKRVGLLRARLG